MPKIQTLIAKFENRQKRWESDCLVLTLIFEEYRTATSQETRDRIAQWAIPILETEKITPLTFNNLLRHLFRNRHSLSKEHLSRFRGAIRNLIRSRKSRKMYLFAKPPKRKK